MSRRVAIVGGGLAGLSCAKYLVDAGYQVSLYESLPYLGGRASTYRDADGDWIEQGLHIFLGTYSAFKTLLREIGRPPDHVLFWMTEIRVQEPDGPEAVYGINPLHAPFKTLLSFLGQNSFLGPLDKLGLVPVSLPAVRSMERLREKFDGQSVADWWTASGGTSNDMERFLRPFCRAIQFTDAEEFSAYNFLGWIHHVLYDLPHSLAGGYRGARDELIFAPLGRYLTDHGVRIQTGAKLREITYAPDTRLVHGLILETGERVDADAYVIAIPAWTFAPLIPGPLRGDPFFAGISGLPVAPAISTQIWFDRPVVSNSDFVLVGSCAMPVYQDQSRKTYPYPRGSRISTTISPAEEYLSWSDAALVQMTVDLLGKVQREVRGAHVVKSVVLRHPKHLIRPLPGAMSARPTQKTPVPNLFLAGDWTQQDYFGSQEGAVRSGRACADAIAGSPDSVETSQAPS
jgi:15-cis-phytoene desaturase